MEELRRPIGPEHTEVITSDGTHQVEIAPAGACINFMQPHGEWAECDPAAVETLTGSSGRSRSVFSRLPLTVGVRTDANETEIVTLRLSSDPSKASEIAFSLVRIEDDGAAQTVDLTEHVVDGQIVNKGAQVVDVVNAGTLRLLTPYRHGIKSRRVVYTVTVPEGYSIVQGETWPELHDQSGYLRSLRAVLLDKDMQPVMDGSSEMPMPLDAIALSVAADGVDESGRPRYTLTKSSKIDLSSVGWAWFDVEVTSTSLGATTVINCPSSASWAQLRAGGSGLSTSVDGLAQLKFSNSYPWLGRAFFKYDLSFITTAPIQAILRLQGRTPTADTKGRFVIQKATVSADKSNITTNNYSSFDDTATYCIDEIASTSGIKKYFNINGAYKNNGQYTTLCLRSGPDYDNAAPIVSDDWWGVACGGSGAAGAILILVYSHAGPTKQLYFNESLKPASGRVMFPVRINRADTNGAAVLDGMRVKGGAYASAFNNGLGILEAKTAYSEAIINASKALRVDRSAATSGWPVDFVLPLYGTTNIDVTWESAFESGNTTYSLYYFKLVSSDGKYDCTVWFQPYYGQWYASINGAEVVNQSPKPPITKVRITYNGSQFTIWINDIAMGSFSSNAPAGTRFYAASGGQGLIYALKSMIGSFVLTIGGAEDLHFRKADGTLIPAFCRTATRDTNNAITQIDCRMAVDVADLSGVKLCYGDPSYSDFAVDAAQITGATVAQAEANPQPGTFWSFAPIDNLSDIFTMLRPGAQVPIVQEILGVIIK